MLRHPTLVAVLMSLAAATASAQATFVEKASMTGPASKIDMDLVGPAGEGSAAPPVPVTIGQINAAGTNGGGTLTSITPYDNGAQRGAATYNVITQWGRGLGATTSSPAGQLIVLDPGGATVPTGAQQYASASYRLQFDHKASEFGLQIGDFGGERTLLTIGFYDEGSRVLTATSSAFTSSTKFFGLQNACFDRLDLQLEIRAASWVITELWVPAAVGQAIDPLGVAGCLGSSGQRPTQAPAQPFPVSCSPYTVDLTGAPPSTGAILQVGIPGPYAPFDLGALQGLAGCSVKIPLLPPPAAIPLSTTSAGTSSLTLPIPSGIAGASFATEWWVVDAALGLPIPVTTSNLLEHRVQ